MRSVATTLCGFTLIEMIGVLSIIAILASVIAPSVFKDIKRARQDKEGQTLSVFATHLERFIVDNKRIPSPSLNDWTAAIAEQSSLPVENIANNEKNFRRGYFVDPRFFTTSDTNFPGYIQTGGMASAAVSPRIMLVSLLTGHAPNPPTKSEDFDDIWDQTTDAKLVEGPDIKIARLNLRSIFARLVLTNENTDQPGYQLENGARNSVPAADASGDGLLTRYVIRNTRVSLFGNPFLSGNLDQVLLLDDEKAYAYQLLGSNWIWKKP